MLASISPHTYNKSADFDQIHQICDTHLSSGPKFPNNILITQWSKIIRVLIMCYHKADCSKISINQQKSQTVEKVRWKCLLLS